MTKLPSSPPWTFSRPTEDTLGSGFVFKSNRYPWSSEMRPTSRTVATRCGVGPLGLSSAESAGGGKGRSSIPRSGDRRRRGGPLSGRELNNEWVVRNSKL